MLTRRTSCLQVITTFTRPAPDWPSTSSCCASSAPSSGCPASPPPPFHQAGRVDPFIVVAHPSQARMPASAGLSLRRRARALAATMRFTSPAKNTVLTISDKPEWPALTFHHRRHRRAHLALDDRAAGLSPARPPPKGPSGTRPRRSRTAGGTTVKALAGRAGLDDGDYHRQQPERGPGRRLPEGQDRRRHDGQAWCATNRSSSSSGQERRAREELRQRLRAHAGDQPKPKFEEVSTGSST